MKVLLDSHAFLWFIAGDARLGVAARSAIEDPGNVKYVSAASFWEIAIKHSLGKLPLAQPFDVLFPREMVNGGFVYLPIELAHVSASSRLTYHHHDPFDRMLIAQAIVEQMVLLSKDSEFDPYPVTKVW